eukprot:CAMPEP_0176113728 /NCGR_PEP_ID=MMETSP0120_2-20121206/57112_1 /TAXON_ID=160619 /ORGANISM="Kryptoperidinium foliaceum, Strain CCMP 1326" /LENGTH=152 /DNA_ID=CAMNT_0017447957 /DNA_START=65 /DNA_END=521 /DNA_ORIENTATION=+
MAKTGVVKNWNEEKGFGFIGQDDGGEDLFCHRTALAGTDMLDRGQAVSYDETYDDRRGKTRATNVSVTAAAVAVAGVATVATAAGTAVAAKTMAAAAETITAAAVAGAMTGEGVPALVERALDRRCAFAEGAADTSVGLGRVSEQAEQWSMS